MTSKVSVSRIRYTAVYVWGITTPFTPAQDLKWTCHFTDLLGTLLRGHQPVQMDAYLQQEGRGRLQGSTTKRSAASRLCHFRYRLQQHVNR